MDKADQRIEHCENFYKTLIEHMEAIQDLEYKCEKINDRITYNDTQFTLKFNNCD